jgi:hypothetical protein
MKISENLREIVKRQGELVKEQEGMAKKARAEGDLAESSARNVLKDSRQR